MGVKGEKPNHDLKSCDQVKENNLEFGEAQRK